MTDGEMKSQQKHCMAKMLTNGEMKSQQKRCMAKMLTNKNVKYIVMRYGVRGIL